MPKALAWRELVRKLRALGFRGPEWGGKHPYMVKGTFKLHIPADHHSDVSAGLVKELIRQIGVNVKQWKSL